MSDDVFYDIEFFEVLDGVVVRVGVGYVYGCLVEEVFCLVLFFGFMVGDEFVVVDGVVSFVDVIGVFDVLVIG